VDMISTHPKEVAANNVAEVITCPLTVLSFNTNSNCCKGKLCPLQWSLI